MQLGRSLIVVLITFSFSLAQSSAKASSASGDHSTQHVLDLAKSGHCTEAIPLLKKAVVESTDKAFRRNAGLAGVHCAMVKNQFDAADDFLRQLTRQFPDDPEVLYTAVHTYSDLATRASQLLAVRAPKSSQAHELRAESLEMEGKWDQAAKEYQHILETDPQMPGIHFKMGRLLLSEPKPPADAADQAKREFEQELAIDPSNAGAEYVLGELAAQAQQWDEAIGHFSRAAKLDSGFGDAFLGWGAALVSTKKFSEAVAPLETAVKLQPQNPAAHYNLAIAYTRIGRKEDGEREFSVHREMIKSRQPAEGQPPQSEGTPQQ